MNGLYLVRNLKVPLNKDVFFYFVQKIKKNISTHLHLFKFQFWNLTKLSEVVNNKLSFYFIIIFAKSFNEIFSSDPMFTGPTKSEFINFLTPSIQSSMYKKERV